MKNLNEPAERKTHTLTSSDKDNNYQTLFNFSRLFFWVIDHEGTFLEINSFMARQLGFSRSRLLGKSILLICPEADLDSLLSGINSLEKKEHIYRRFLMTSGTGEPIEIESIMVKCLWKNMDCILGTGWKICKDESVYPGNLASMAETIKELEAKIVRMGAERRYLEKEISHKEILLAEKNITLKQLLDQREKEKQELREEMNKKLQHLILPLIGRIQANGTDSDKKYLKALIHNLKEIITPLFSRTLQNMDLLSPREVEICHLINQGCSSKEIAEMLCLSVQTINTHRKNIRKKLGINSTGINLSTYIKSSDSQ
jgi:PAS domain S-box-containing protein